MDQAQCAVVTIRPITAGQLRQKSGRSSQLVAIGLLSPVTRPFLRTVVYAAEQQTTGLSRKFK